MSTPSYNRHNTRWQMALNIPLQKTNTVQRALSFLGPKILTKVSNSIESVKAAAPFTHALERQILSNLCR